MLSEGVGISGVRGGQLGRCGVVSCALVLVLDLVVDAFDLDLGAITYLVTLCTEADCSMGSST
jgi:hypothetical protein